MNLNLNALGDLTFLATAVAVGLLAAFWLSLVIWTFRDIRRRSREAFTRILAVLIVLLLFLPGFLIYLILRPSTTLEEEYQRSLEEEALLQNIENAALCPGCNRRILPDWMVCPSCHTLLKKQCTHCGKLMELPWNICPYCANPATSEHLEIGYEQNSAEDAEINESTEPDEFAGQSEDSDVTGLSADWINLPGSNNQDSQPESSHSGD